MIFSEERDRVPSCRCLSPSRNPQLSDYYRCVEDYFETFVRGQALEWLVPPLAGCSHIPDRGESRRWREYYGYYSPAFRGISRGKRKETEDDGVPCILEADKSSKEYRKNWARLIQKIGACPRLDRGRSIP